ncbi:glycosyltransferase [Allokutzneria sp. A3M-2-11 16]|uniref:glycosyltransferase n=1 Tax=Allokutzneria sp. A3M-2-11 16 TaxID=2962043 RepID=UPI0020B8EADB|nr:glycosyltransferase [Allokutzneria sp. A3M-2-11 16]MCP3800828.1 glycosyltransferase [Allokutzneria sp. A3M-2-11 16]
MRVLCTVTGSPSHTRSLVPIIRALAEAGHEVLVAMPEDFVQLFAAEKVTAVGALYGMRQQLTKMVSDPERPLHPPANPGDMSMVMRAMSGPLAADSFQRVLPVAEEFRPDVVLRDDAEYGAVLLAEKLGIPHLCLPGGFVNAGLPELAEQTLREHAPHGLDLGRDFLYRYGRIDYVPTEFSYTAAAAPIASAYRQPVLVRPGERLPGWLADAPADRPLVLAAIGTALPMTTELDKSKMALPPSLAGVDPSERLRVAVEALSTLDCTAIVATGGVPIPDAPIAPNVHLVQQVPQPLVLECADLFLTHGGYNGIREALRSGVPMVVQPAFGDQPSNADRTVELGLGLRIHDGGVEEVREACSRVLGEPGFTARSRQAKRAVLALPDLDQAVRDIEAVAKLSSVR